jgi:Asp-tRNA(Asn)/Glu-tRNA(Gln) amidotransferase A subunit family amidase
MDKIGPICRSAEDCAIVFSQIAGADPRDRSTVDRPFDWRHDLDIKRLKIGFAIGQNDDPADHSRLERDDYLRELVKLGVKPTPVKFDPAPPGVNAVLGVEAAAAFDDFTRSERIEELKNSSWPNTYRGNRYFSAVDYLRAQRARWLLMQRFEEQLAEFDVIVANERGGSLLFITNLTGHPQVLVPNGTTEQGAQRSFSVIGRLYGEGTALAVAHKLQLALGNHLGRPDLGKL